MWIPNTTQRNLSQKQTHIENRSVVAKRRGGRGLDWKFGIARCRLLDTGCISNKVFYPIQHSRGQPFVNPWTIQSLEFSRPEHQSEWPFPSPGALPNPGIEPRSSKLQSDSYQLSHKGSPRILECVAYPSSSGSSRPRNQTADLPDPGIKPGFPGLQADSLPAELPGKALDITGNYI